MGGHRITLTVQERLEANRKIDPDTGCWLWLGLLSPSGYGRIRIDGANLRVHRVAMRLYKCTDLPDDVLVLHKPPCINRACFNPEHLYLGTAKDNARDMVEAGRHSENRKTQCIHGHEFTKDNTMYDKNGNRKCRACHLYIKRTGHAPFEFSMDIESQVMGE